MTSETETETEWIKRAKVGDQGAFEALYNAYHERIYTYIYYRVGDTALAEDLTGDVFVKMVTKIDTFEPGGKPFVAWLYTVAGNLVRDTVRRNKIITWTPLQDYDMAEKDSFVKTIDDKLTHAHMREALEELTDEQREVIILRFIEGQTAPTVAAAIGKTVTSVKALQRRAIQALRKQLQSRGVYV